MTRPGGKTTFDDLNREFRWKCCYQFLGQGHAVAHQRLHCLLIVPRKTTSEFQCSRIIEGLESGAHQPSCRSRIVKGFQPICHPHSHLLLNLHDQIQFSIVAFWFQLVDFFLDLILRTAKSYAARLVAVCHLKTGVTGR